MLRFARRPDILTNSHFRFPIAANMHQAQVTEWGQLPKYAEVSEPPAPAPNETRVKVVATGLHQVVRSRASGQHYSSGPLPHVPGIDGVGTTDDGKNVYFMSMDVGTMAEYINMPKRNIMPLPDGVDPIQAAGITNPALSSWMAFKARTTNLPKDFSVLILGATSASGRVAIPLARSLGAKRIVGAARNKNKLDTLGLDESIVIEDEVEKTDFSTVGDVDVVLDYIYGPLAVHFFSSIKPRTPVQYVHIGGLSGVMEISLPGAVLRSRNLTIRGSGPGAWSLQEVASVMPDMLAAFKNVPEQPLKVEKLENVESVWTNGSSDRVVFVP